MEVLGDDGFGEGAAAAKLSCEGDGVNDEDGGLYLVPDNDVVNAFVAHGEGNVKHG